MKKLLAFLLIGALCASFLIAPVSAAPADSDTLAVAALTMMGAIQGDGTGSLGLTGTVTRAQLCKIAVVMMGLSDKVSQYAGYTIFPDVPSPGWAVGYVNLAVRQAGIITGYPDGTFSPNDTVTYGQAVTILMKILGYTTADVGAVWPDGYMSKAGEIGLTDGVSLSASAGVTKGVMARLFLNLLNTTVKGTGNSYLETIPGTSAVSNVFLVSSDAVTDDGDTGAVQIAGAQSGTYLPAGIVPEALIGAYGSLLLNSSGKALTFIPETDGSNVVSAVSDTTSNTITCADGTKITMSSKAAFYLDGEAASYGNTWADIRKGMLVSAHYSGGGALQCVMVTSAGWGGSNVTVVTGDTYYLPASSTVIINGNLSNVSDINQYDVISYSGTGFYSVTRRQITGCLEDADPNTGAPETVTLLGTDFEVLESAAADLAGIRPGDTVTLLLTTDNRVAGIVPGTSLNLKNYGVVTDLTSATVTLALSCGMTLSGRLGDIASDIAVGSLVSVASGEDGALDIYKVYSRTTASSLDIPACRLGSDALSRTVTVYESIGDGAVRQISLSDIPLDTVTATKIRFSAYDAAGNVDLLVLNDVTGDMYTYGFISSGTKTVTTDGMSATYNTTSVTNSNGKTTAVGGTGFSAGTLAGIAVTTDGQLAGASALTAAGEISRNDFRQNADGTYSVILGSGAIPVADDIQVYLTETGTWTTLAKARSYSDTLTIYYDKTIETGGKVRVIVAE
jgi:hypothetical protein